MQQKLLLIQIQIEIFANVADILCTSHPIVNFHLKISIINQNINFSLFVLIDFHDMLNSIGISFDKCDFMRILSFIQWIYLIL